MINTNFIPTKVDGQYCVYYFNNLIESTAFEKLKNATTNYPFNFINGKRTDAVERIWLHQTTDNSLKQLAASFDSLEIKQLFSRFVNTDLTSMYTRIELCNDIKGSWLEDHVDDPAKKFTLQFYLTNIKNSTIHNGKSRDAVENNGWFFLNTGTEYHSLSPLTAARSSIIVNYVDELWRDKAVLV